MAKQDVIKFFRKSTPGAGAAPDGTLEYGEPQVDQLGNLYLGIPDGSGGTITVKIAGPEAFSTTFSMSPSGLQLVGNVITNPSFTASYSLSPTTADLVVPNGDTQLASTIDLLTPNTLISGTPPTSFSYLETFTLNSVGLVKSFTLNSGSVTGTDSDVQSFTAANYIYYGSAPTGSFTTNTDTSTIISTGTMVNVLQTGKSFSTTVNVDTTNNKIYFLVRSALGALTSIIANGFESIGAFTNIGIIQVNNESTTSFTESYDVYEWNNTATTSASITIQAS